MTMSTSFTSKTPKGEEVRMEELIKIQNRLKAPKNLYNKFGGFYYRNAESILTAVKPLLDEYKCLLLLTDEIVEVGGRVYVKATATITAPDGSHVSVEAFSSPR